MASAVMQNFDGGTFLGNLVTRPEFLQYIREDIYFRCKWVQSGVMVRNSALDCRDRGVRIEVPFFNPIPEEEVRIQSNATWGQTNGGFLVPNRITGDSQIATIMHRGGAFAADQLSKLGTGADPMAAIASYLSKTVQILRTRTLNAQLEGLFGGALAGNALDVSQATAGAGEANFLTAQNVIRARNLLGERGEELGIIAMHSDVYSYLLSVGLLTFSTDSLVAGGNIEWGGGGIAKTAVDVAYFCGLRIVQDDLLAPPVNAGGADQYPVYIMAPGTVYEGVQAPFQVKYDYNILSFQDVMAWDHHYTQHIYGTSWVAAGDNPENADLATANNWELAYNDRRLIPAVRLTVNSPFAANV